MANIETIAVVNEERKRRVINLADLAEWRKRGWIPEAEAALHPEPDADMATPDTVPPALDPDLTVSQLRKLAAEMGVDISDLKRKDDIYSALELSLSQRSRRG